MAVPVGMILGGLGTILDLIGQSEDKAYSAGVYANNERLAQRAAADAYMRGAVEAGRARTATTKLISQQKLAYANSGVDMTSGTPARVIGETRLMGELDAQTIENNAVREAWGFKTKARQIHDEWQHDSNRRDMKAAGTVLGSVGDLAGAAGDYTDGGGM